ncbi:MAG TPA: hypothetical protein VGR38_05120 [Candidatus Polarisedimenticolia bacterium]|jgi:hypothetical protein|nr:hypothetical protein [Candidatus Polarisedimenticolia bacterium]
MKHERTAQGGLRMELDAREATLLRYLAERATFIDTPPEEQAHILRLAEQILQALGQKDES